MTDSDAIDPRSHDLVGQNIKALGRLFPEAITEAGKIDFERLKMTLGESIEVGKERFGLTWPGKADCFKVIQQPSLATLRPDKAASVNFDNSEHVIIEGDNLEVLRLLQKSYLGKIKVICIDPPYNTGNEFIYPDKFSESLETYLRYTGQTDSEGRKWGANTETDGRFHSNWLNMMYPRLFLARNLLAQDGAIFVTIDDGEVHTLRMIMNEIFGEDNFVAQIEWQKRYTRSNNTDDFTSVIDHVVVYAKSDQFKPQLFQREEEANARYQNPDNDPRGVWKAVPFLNPLSPEERPNLVYPIIHPRTGETIIPKRKAWRSEEAVWKKLVAENRIWWGKGLESETPNIKRFLSEVRQGMTPINFWDYEFAGHTDSANQEIKVLFEDKVFDTPKPTKLIQRMIETASSAESECIVLDFFAGSGTTAQAVLEMNERDGGNRQFILVQLPEPTGRQDYKTISEITAERVRRVIKKLESESSGTMSFEKKVPVRGFKFFRLDQSGFKIWQSSVEAKPAELARQLDLHVDQILEGRTDDDLLVELMLKSGFSLTTSVNTLTLADKKVFSVADGALLICLDRHLTPELLRAVADLQPVRVLFLDAGFAGNDQLKTNAVQQMRARGVTKFQTV